jgi:hypothetical protein
MEGPHNLFDKQVQFVRALTVPECPSFLVFVLETFANTPPK